MTASDVLFTAIVGGSATLGAGLVAAATPRLRLATRRALLLASLVVAALAPAIVVAATALGVGLRAAPATPDAAAAAQGERAIPSFDGRAARDAGPAAPPVANAGRDEMPLDRSSTGSSRIAAGVERGAAAPWALVSLLLWGAGTAFALARIAVSLLHVRRLSRSLVTARDPRTAGSFETDDLRVPATLGWLRPVVALPAGLARELSDHDLDAILRHERAHVARLDPLASLAARISRSLHWPNPLAHLAVARFDATCESLADAEAVAQGRAAPSRYAACLVRMAERARGHLVPASVCSISGRGGRLSRRVEALLTSSAAGLDARSSRIGLVGALAFALLSAVGIGCCCPRPAASPPRAAAPSQAPATRMPPFAMTPEERSTVERAINASRSRWRTSAARVVGFSPAASPVDAKTGLASPSFTDGSLRISTDPAYPGKVVVFFEPDAALTESTAGPSTLAVQFLRYVPGTGNVPVELAPHGREVLADRVILAPARLPLPNGQYSIGVFWLVDGGAVGPAFHSFTVGSADSIPPTVVTSTPARIVVVSAGWVDGCRSLPVPARVEEVRFGPASSDVAVRFSEAIEPRSLTPETIRVTDVGAFVPGGAAPPRVPAAPGFPQLRSAADGSSLLSNGFEVVWRADPKSGGFPAGTTIEVEVVGSDGGVNRTAITDRAGNPLEKTFRFRFETPRPPSPR